MKVLCSLIYYKNQLYNKFDKHLTNTNNLNMMIHLIDNMFQYNFVSKFNNKHFYKLNKIRTTQYVFAELVPVVDTPEPRELNGSLHPVPPVQ